VSYLVLAYVVLDKVFAEKDNYMDMDKRVEFWRIHNEALPEVNKIFNHNDPIFKSYIIGAVPGPEYSTVMVEIEGSYPYIEWQWPKQVESLNNSKMPAKKVPFRAKITGFFSRQVTILPC
jgi:hypothetical protein